jgi:hypothetical protein
MSGWVGMHLLKQRGVDTVSRLSAHRRADFRKGKRLGKDDHLMYWKKPSSIRSVDRQTYNSLPDSITVREARFRATRSRSAGRRATAFSPVKTPGIGCLELPGPNPPFPAGLVMLPSDMPTNFPEKTVLAARRRDKRPPVPQA